VFSRRPAGRVGGALAAEPSLWQERLGVVKVPRGTMDAIRMKGELRLLGDDPTRSTWRQQIFCRVRQNVVN